MASWGTLRMNLLEASHFYRRTSLTADLYAVYSGKPANICSANPFLPLRPNTVLHYFGQLPRSILNHPRTQLLHDSQQTPTNSRHIHKRSLPLVHRNFLQPDKGMSNLLRIYREHTLEMLYQPQTHSDVKFQPANYLDTRVLNQEHPAFPLYLLMSAHSFREVYQLTKK
jgi:hypothetical protein